ncbi:MAG TPA: type II secretion system protein [Thermoanaerobaculia bacterium]
MSHEPREIDMQNASKPAASPKSIRRSLQSGFSLIELIVVVTIIGILASVALVNVRYAQRKAREAALKDNLFQMRKSIDNFYADKQRYPGTLEELVPNYLRRLPVDPITGQVDWEPIMDDPMDEMASNPDPQAISEPGIIDIRSVAEGSTLEDVPYQDL